MNKNVLEITKRIRELREILEIDVPHMAKTLKISDAEYISMESGEKDIPISTIYEIAAALNTDMSVILLGEEPKMNTYSVMRVGEGLPVERYEGYSFESLAFNFKGRTMEPLMVTLDKKDSPPALVTHGGQEFNIVLEGTVEVTVGKHKFALNRGDSIYFNPAIPHGQRAVTETAEFLTVINDSV